MVSPLGITTVVVLVVSSRRKPSIQGLTEVKIRAIYRVIMIGLITDVLEKVRPHVIKTKRFDFTEHLFSREDARISGWKRWILSDVPSWCHHGRQLRVCPSI